MTKCAWVAGRSTEIHTNKDNSWAFFCIVIGYHVTSFEVVINLYAGAYSEDLVFVALPIPITLILRVEYMYYITENNSMEKLIGKKDNN